MHPYEEVAIGQSSLLSLIARFVGSTWGPSGADRTQVGPMLAPWTLLSGMIKQWLWWGSDFIALLCVDVLQRKPLREAMLLFCAPRCDGTVLWLSLHSVYEATVIPNKSYLMFCIAKWGCQTFFVWRNTYILLTIMQNKHFFIYVLRRIYNHPYWAC